MLLIASALAAQVYTEGGSGISVETRYAWPLKVDRGYVPVKVRVDNGSQEERTLRLEWLESYGYSAKIKRDVTLEPGERRELEVLLPAYLDHAAQHSLTVYEGGAWVTSISSIGPYDRSVDGRGSLLLLGQDEAEWEEVQHWVDALVLSDANSVGAVAFDDLPTSQGAYTSVSAVLLDTSEGLPDREKLEPLASWVRLGGSLVLVGDEARDVALDEELFADWMEPRFAWTPWLEGGLLPGLNSQQMGLGQLAFLSDEEKDQPLIVQSVIRPAWNSTLSRRLPRGSRGDVGAMPEIPGVGSLPRGMFAFLMIGVAFLLGPVNAFVVRLLKRPASLLATTPVLALTSTAVLVGYGLAHNGLGVRTANHSVTLLDQRSHTAATHNVRQLYVGFSPPGGIRPSADTFHFPVRPDWDFMPEMSWDEGPILSGDLAPVRKATRQVVLTEGPARQRLEVIGEQAANSLGADIRQLVLRTDAGWYVLDQLDDGDSAALVPVEEPDLERLIDSDMATRPVDLWPDRALDWPVGTYVARLDSSPFLDDEGVEPQEAAGEHWVVGVLEGT